MITSALPADLTNAWAHHPMHGGRFAHWFTRGKGGAEIREIASACGLVRGYETASVRLLCPGNMPRCKHCDQRSGAAA